MLKIMQILIYYFFCVCAKNVASIHINRFTIISGLFAFFYILYVFKYKQQTNLKIIFKLSIFFYRVTLSLKNLMQKLKERFMMYVNQIVHKM